MNKILNRIVIKYFPTFTSFYRNTRDWFEQRRPAIKTPWGFYFAGHDAMALGEFKPVETDLIRKKMSEADVLVNVGANVGYYCCHALSMGIPIIAIEPNSRNLGFLLKNIKNNNWEKIAEVFPVAIGKNNNILKMWGGGTGASIIKGWASIDEGYVTQVPVLSLDRILGDKLKGKRALIVVDVEGAEYMMLEGAIQTLINEPKPIWMVEISTSENQPEGSIMNPYFEKTFQIFFSNGYRAFTANEEFKEITSDSLHQIMAGVQLPTTYNFIFKI